MTLPGWPAMMRRPLAAAYCQLTVPEFEREIAEGRLPLPVRLGKTDHWSKAKLDNALDAIAGGTADWRQRLGLHHAA